MKKINVLVIALTSIALASCASTSKTTASAENGYGYSTDRAPAQASKTVDDVVRILKEEKVSGAKVVDSYNEWLKNLSKEERLKLKLKEAKTEDDVAKQLKGKKNAEIDYLDHLHSYLARGTDAVSPKVLQRAFENTSWAAHVATSASPSAGKYTTTKLGGTKTVKKVDANKLTGKFKTEYEAIAKISVEAADDAVNSATHVRKIAGEDAANQVLSGHRKIAEATGKDVNNECGSLTEPDAVKNYAKEIDAIGDDLAKIKNEKGRVATDEEISQTYVKKHEEETGNNGCASWDALTSPTGGCNLADRKVVMKTCL